MQTIYKINIFWGLFENSLFNNKIRLKSVYLLQTQLAGILILKGLSGSPLAGHVYHTDGVVLHYTLILCLILFQISMRRHQYLKRIIFQILLVKDLIFYSKMTNTYLSLYKPNIVFYS